MDESRGSEHYLRSIFPEIAELYEFGIYIYFSGPYVRAYHIAATGGSLRNFVPTTRARLGLAAVPSSLNSGKLWYEVFN